MRFENLNSSLEQLKTNSNVLDRLIISINGERNPNLHRFLILQSFSKEPLNGLYCVSSDVNINASLEKLHKLFGGVRWYNSNAIHSDEITYNYNEQEQGYNKGLMFDNSVNALFLTHFNSLLNTTINEMSDTMQVGTYHVREKGTDKTLNQQSSIGLVKTPRGGLWDDVKLKRQIKIPGELFGSVDFIYTNYNKVNTTNINAEKKIKSEVAYAHFKNTRNINITLSEQNKKIIQERAEELFKQRKQLTENTENSIIETTYTDLYNSLRKIATAYSRVNGDTEVSESHIEKSATLIKQSWSTVANDDIIQEFKSNNQQTTNKEKKEKSQTN